jgi:hypothetical protein
MAAEVLGVADFMAVAGVDFTAAEQVAFTEEAPQAVDSTEEAPRVVDSTPVAVVSAVDLRGRHRRDTGRDAQGQRPCALEVDHLHRPAVISRARAARAEVTRAGCSEEEIRSRVPQRLLTVVGIRLAAQQVAGGPWGHGQQDRARLLAGASAPSEGIAPPALQVRREASPARAARSGRTPRSREMSFRPGRPFRALRSRSVVPVPVRVSVAPALV